MLFANDALICTIAELIRYKVLFPSGLIAANARVLLDLAR
jgi:hypothetical protein